MSEQFYTILTSLGKAKIANSGALGTKVSFVKFKVGDGGGTYYNPTEDQVDVKNKVWEGNISSITIDENNSNWIVIETVIPTLVGGFTIREAGIFDDENNLIAIGKYPETYKPVAAEGSSKDLLIRMILEVSNAENVNLKVDPTIILATKKDIQVLESKMNDLINKFNLHLADNKDHVPYAIATGSANVYAATLSPAATDYIDGMALSIKINVASTAASTININGLGAKAIKKSNGNDVTNLKANAIYTMRYNGTNFILQGEGASGDALASQLLLGKKAGTDAGDIVGTMPNNAGLGGSLPINGSYNIPAGYTTGGTISQSVATKAYAEIMPGTSDQVIGANQWLTGNQVVKGDGDLIASNIVSTANIFGVQGSASKLQYASGTTNGTRTYLSGNANAWALNLNGLTSFTPDLVLCESNVVLGGSGVIRKSMVNYTGFGPKYEWVSNGDTIDWFNTTYFGTEDLTHIPLVYWPTVQISSCVVTWKAYKFS